MKRRTALAGLCFALAAAALAAAVLLSRQGGPAGELPAPRYTPAPSAVSPTAGPGGCAHGHTRAYPHALARGR